MKILHVWNTAGVASILAKHMDRLYDTSSKVITRNHYDRYGLTTYGEVWNTRAKIFLYRTFLLARKFDIIHIHSLNEIVPKLRMYKKPLILHYHGSDIRGKWEDNKHIWSHADAIIVATRDLLDGAPDNVIYLPNPIDTDLFYDRDKRIKGTAFHISYNADNDAKYIAKRLNLKLTVHDRKTNPIPYKEMPELLSKYEYYIDIRRDSLGNIYENISKTGLEALACNCKVITWNEKLLRELPEENQPSYVTKKLLDLYKRLIDKHS